MKKIYRALISVSDKTGLVDLAKELSKNNIEIVSTGSTASYLEENNIKVIPVSDVTNFPEILDGRVKTLHPAIHGGILANLNIQEHVETIKKHEIVPIDLVVVNLYPFAQTVAKTDDESEIIENIDIGGPTLVRAAAKNFEHVCVLVDPSQYPEAISKLKSTGFSLEDRRQYAAYAFNMIANYDNQINVYFSSGKELNLVATHKTGLRYGENPHQSADLYVDSSGFGLANAKVISGKEMSFNNYTDTDAALRAVYDFETPTVAIIKHANPCGIATDKNIVTAYQKAHECDPVSAYGGIIASNQEVTADFAKAMEKVFTEVIVAPSFTEDALKILSAKKNLRIVQVKYKRLKSDLKPISGGVLIQDSDLVDQPGDDVKNWKLATSTAASQQQIDDLMFAWRTLRSVKSNAIVIAKDNASVGIGMGQVSRVDSAKIALMRAGEKVENSVAASDAFFPFADGAEILCKAGIKAIVQPGGSIRDDEVISVCEKYGVSMYFTGIRHFTH